MASTLASTADDQVAAFVDRILRMKEEEKAIKSDIREIYAEAKANGHDKTVIGKIVNYVEKREKASADLQESEALFDLYLAAYDRAKGRVGTGRATHTHEDDVDPTTGEIIETNSDVPTTKGSPAPNEGVSDTGSSDANNPGVAAAHINSAVVADQGGEGTDPALSAEPVLLQEGGVEAEGQGGATREQGSGEPSQPLLPTDRVENKPDGPAVIGAEPIRDAAVEKEPSRQSHKLEIVGASPTPATIFPAGSIRHETAPAVGVVRHEIQRCFPERWGPATADLKDDIRANGVLVPIVMQGNVLLDGWARFMAARDLHVDYPVQEYAGDDPLADIIRLNIASRDMNLVERQAVAKKLTKLWPDRAADIAELLDLEQAREAAQ